MLTRSDQEAGGPERKIGARLLLAASALLGGGSLILFCVFLLVGPLGLVRFELEPMACLWLDTALSALFFVQHSTMTRRTFRERLSRVLPRELHAALYSAVSGACLLVVVLLWQESPPVLLRAEGAMRFLLRLVFLAALAGFWWGERALHPLDALGIRDLVRHIRGRSSRPAPFTVRGPYRWVRHPLYFFALVLFWAQPDLTADRLLFNVLWTVWVFIGTVLEERELVATFGSRYLEYRRRVPMLLPVRPPLPVADRSLLEDGTEPGH